MVRASRSWSRFHYFGTIFHFLAASVPAATIWIAGSVV